ncbi:MAG: hypothetical protein HYX60_11690, partial [Legionella longbeachae]|nr:hypothetical protein [Legionella longbeachae]
KVSSAGSTLDYIERTARQIQYVEQQQVWPGFHPAATPTIIQMVKQTLTADGIDEKRTAYAFNFTPSVFLWEKITSYDYLYFLADAKPLELENHADGKYVTVDGQRSYVDIENEYNISEQENVYNKFMRSRASTYLQNESTINPVNTQYTDIVYDGFNQIDLIKLAYLEDAALTQVQQSDASSAEEALRDAVAIQQYRNSILNKDYRVFENANEIITGIPDYITWTSQQLNEEDYRKMTQRSGCRPLKSFTGPEEIADCMLLKLPAFSSSVYGHAFEKKQPGLAWKIDVEQQFKSISQMAIDHYNFTDEQARFLTETAMNKAVYQYKRINQIINTRMKPYLDSLHMVFNQYQEMQGPELRTDLQLGILLITFSPYIPNLFQDIYTVNSHTILLTNINLVPDQTIKLVDDKAVLVFNHLPFMGIHLEMNGLQVDDAKSYTGFKLSDEALLILDDHTYLAKDFIQDKKVEKFYHSFTVKDKYMIFTSPVSGIFDASEGGMRLKETETVKNSVKPTFNGLIDKLAQREMAND